MNPFLTFFSFLRGPARVHWHALVLPVLVMLLAALLATSARADVWGYVDTQGMGRFSATQLDERYEFFSRGGESLSAQNTGETSQAPGRVTDRATGVTAATAKLLAFFDVSPSYKAVKYLLREAALTYGIDYELLQALIATESGFNTRAVSPKGAVGLMQLIPPTAARYGVRADKNSPIEKKLKDPRINIRAGSSYLSDLIKLFPGQLELAIAAYNAGEGAVQRAGNKIPNYPETINYVKTVMQLYNQLKPPSMIAARGRVRMEIVGGARGRGNEVSPLVAFTTPSEVEAVPD
ncbi:MAG: lytic transglycosylase domain-containing protein [Polaromonas sp.]